MKISFTEPNSVMFQLFEVGKWLVAEVTPLDISLWFPLFKGRCHADGLTHPSHQQSPIPGTSTIINH